MVHYTPDADRSAQGEPQRMPRFRTHVVAVHSGMLAAVRPAHAGSYTEPAGTGRVWALQAKYTLDKAMALLLILLFLPWLLFIALAVKLQDGGPVFFRQLRYGQGGQPFTVLKFRTMRHDSQDPLGRQQTARGDDRVTRLGRILRRTSIDELPQLLNVLFGDMSLVGPRPHPLGMQIDGRLLPDAVPHYLQRYGVRPGITGWAQVNGNRGAVDTKEHLLRRLEWDLYYVENWSLWLDARILARSVPIVFFDKNAY